jgi:hypothetical protein
MVSTTYSGVALNNAGYSDGTGNYNITGFVNGQNSTSAGITLSGSMAFDGSTSTSVLNEGTYTQGAGTLAMSSAHNNYVMSFSNTPAQNYVINPATLTYVANPTTANVGSPFPSLTGTVTGFVPGQNQASATTGTLTWTTPATPGSLPGSYPIDGSGLTANSGNYVFAQAAGNATALTLDPAPPPIYTPPNPSNNPPNNPTNITFQNPNFLFHVSFTPNGPFADNGDNSNPASLPPGNQFTHNNGFDFPPISQYDGNQYSDFKLPPYDNDDSESAILTILARGASPGHGQDYMIDNFWNGTDATWPGPGHIGLFGKLTFSDGAGHDVTPTNDAGFPIVAGKTDFAQLLKNGPVMIGGPANQTPAQWLLATGMAPDGKGIICDDPATGGLVELSYDPTTETVGGITGVFNPKTNGFVALADAGSDIPTNDASGLSGLQSFVPSTYYAVTVH